MSAPTREEIDAMTGAVLLEFGSSSCPHCKAIQPMLAGIRTTYPQLHHIKIEDGPGQRLGRSFRVKLWPTLIFMKDGNVVGEIVRPPSEEIIHSLAELTIGAAASTGTPDSTGNI